MPKKTYQFGNFCENLAINFLRLKGYRILQHRYKCRFGEIDIIAFKNNQIIFIEVKARKKTALIETILRAKQIQRIKNAAEFYVASNENLQNFDWRFDFILFEESLIPQHFKDYY